MRILTGATPSLICELLSIILSMCIHLNSFVSFVAFAPIFATKKFRAYLSMTTNHPKQWLWKMKGAHLNLLASSMKGLLSRSESSFQSAPSRFEISELCIFGFSWAIFLLCPRDHTMKAFMGRLIWSPAFGPGPIMLSCWRKDPSELALG